LQFYVDVMRSDAACSYSLNKGNAKGGVNVYALPDVECVCGFGNNIDAAGRSRMDAGRKIKASKRFCGPVTYQDPFAMCILVFADRDCIGEFILMFQLDS
jgi:hypothetical protein